MFWPYLRDPETLARPWALPGTPGLMHRIGGLEKADGSGNVSYDPVNHDRWSACGRQKVAGIANDIPLVEVDDPDGLGGADLLVLGWGSTYGAIQAAIRGSGSTGPPGGARPPAPPQPVPAQPGRNRAAYKRVLVPEMNLGQLCKLVRAEFLVDAKGLNKVQRLAVPADRVSSCHRLALGFPRPQAAMGRHERRRGAQ